MRWECRDPFPRHRGLAIPTYITARAWHVPWCMPGSLTSGFLVGSGENIPSVCATHNFTYLVRGSLGILTLDVPRNLGPISLLWINLIPTWISSYIHYKVWGEIIYPFLNFNGATVDVWEWISNFIRRFTGNVTSCPYWDLSYSM